MKGKNGTKIEFSSSYLGEGLFQKRHPHFIALGLGEQGNTVFARDTVVDRICMPFPCLSIKELYVIYSPWGVCVLKKELFDFSWLLRKCGDGL